MINLRQYQTDGVAGIRSAFANGRTAPLYVLPTGGGKTVTFSYIADAARERGRRVYILVHRQELVSQVSETLTAFGVQHGFIIAGRSQKQYRERVYICSVQTLASRIRRGKTPPEPDLIIIDEAHHATAKTWADVLTEYNAAAVLGVTATACRTDGVPLRSVFDSLIMGPTVPNLIQLGALVPPVVYAPPCQIDTSGLRKSRGDWTASQVAGRVDKPTITGDVIEHYQRHANGLQAVAFCCSIEHAQNVAAAFRGAGIDAAVISGKMENSERRKLIADFRAGRVRVLTSVDIVGEGFDVPNIGAAIMLRPTASLGLHLQQCGRALRPAAGKTQAIILDHAGNTQRHGLPTDVFIWSLDGKPKRASAGEAAIQLRICGKCYAAYTAADCPQCGETPEIKPREFKQVDGELQLIDPAKIDPAILAMQAKARRREVGKAGTLDALIALGNERGYKQGWARQIFKARGGVVR